MRVIKSFILISIIFLEAISASGQKGTANSHTQDTIPIKTDTLKAAIVTARLRPKLKGDTIEYNTENTRLQLYSNVEDLLAELPGLHIDPDGTITYNGEKIQHLLVDGEDIFGSDPTMVTRNFNASKIAKIQILDRKTDQSLFTGIDNGVRNKTLNLVLKQSAKNGTFGKAEVGSNSQGMYNANAASATFRNKEQFTAIGVTSNTGGIGGTTGASTTIPATKATGDPFGASAGTGIPHILGAALHYANTWGGTKQHISLNSQYGHFDSQPVTTMQSQQVQQDSIYGQNQRSQSLNIQDQKWLSGLYDVTFNSGSAIEVLFHITNSTTTNNLAAVETSTFNDTLVNDNRRTIRDTGKSRDIGGTIMWKTPIDKAKKQTLSFAIGGKEVSSTTNGYIYSLTTFYRPNGIIQAIDTVDQRKELAARSKSFYGNINYAKQLGKTALLGFSYELSFSDDQPLQLTFSQTDGKYQQIVDSLSSRFKTKTIDQRALVNIDGHLGHFTYSIGNNWIGSTHHQKDDFYDTTSTWSNFNWAPRAKIVWKLNQTTNFIFNYNATTQQPSNKELEPIKNNNDPMHIILGNPGLKPELIQSLRLDFQRLKNWIVNISLNITSSNNSISTNTFTDSFGRQVSQPVNVAGSKMGGINLTIARKVLGFDFGFISANNYSRTNNLINGALNQNDVYTTSAGITLARYEYTKYSFQFATNFAYLKQTSSTNSSASLHYWSQNHTGSITLFPIRNWEFNTTAVYNWQERANIFSKNTSVLLWNANISRRLLADRLVLKALVNNIVNQNAGVNRSNVLNTYTQSSTNILGRCWMFSAIWHFDRNFKRE